MTPRRRPRELHSPPAPGPPVALVAPGGFSWVPGERGRRPRAGVRPPRRASSSRHAPDAKARDTTRLDGVRVIGVHEHRWARTRHADGDGFVLLLQTLATPALGVTGAATAIAIARAAGTTPAWVLGGITASEPLDSSLHCTSMVGVEPVLRGDEGQERPPHDVDSAAKLIEGVTAIADEAVPGDGGDDRLGHGVDVQVVP